MQKEIDLLLQRKMDRKDFIKHVGIGFVAISGIAAFVKSMTNTGSSSTVGATYGSNAYGGQKKS